MEEPTGCEADFTGCRPAKGRQINEHKYYTTHIYIYIHMNEYVFATRYICTWKMYSVDVFTVSESRQRQASCIGSALLCIQEGWSNALLSLAGSSLALNSEVLISGLCGIREAFLLLACQADLRLRAWSIREKAAHSNEPCKGSYAFGWAALKGWRSPAIPTRTRDFGVSSTQHHSAGRG